MEETKKHENETGAAQTDNKQPAQQKSNFKMSEKLKGILRRYFGTKPFADVVDVIQLNQKDILTEDEINLIVNRLGRFPFDEVEEIFNLFTTEVTAIPTNGTPAEPANENKQK